MEASSCLRRNETIILTYIYYYMYIDEHLSVICRCSKYVYIHTICIIIIQYYVHTYLYAAFFTSEGFIDSDEAYRIVKNYSAVYPNSVNVDALMFRKFCDECTVLDKGRPLIHTEDVMEYLINFN